jgi:hypothetical protein
MAGQKKADLALAERQGPRETHPAASGNPTRDRERAPSAKALPKGELRVALTALTRCMRSIAEGLDGDYATAMIFLIIAESSLHGFGPRTDPRASLPGLSTLAISRLSGIPRETVRRKVERLRSLNLIAIDGTKKDIYIHNEYPGEQFFVGKVEDYISFLFMIDDIKHFYAELDARRDAFWSGAVDVSDHDEAHGSGGGQPSSPSAESPTPRP